MPTSSTVLKSQKGSSKIMRAKFGPGMLLQSEDLEQLNFYTRDLSRLLFRSFFGCGVICGLRVTAEEKCGKTMVTVDPGVALNCAGDPIHVPKEEEFPVTDGCDPKTHPSRLWVWLCSCPKCCAPRPPSCGCDDGDAAPACTREVDGYVIHVGTEPPKCACGCELKALDDSSDAAPENAEAEGTASATAQTAPNDSCWCADPQSPCYKPHYDGVCGCECDDSNCVMLTLLIYDDNEWTSDYRVRRYIRPVLARDPWGGDPKAKSVSEASSEVEQKATVTEKVAQATEKAEKAKQKAEAEKKKAMAAVKAAAAEKPAAAEKAAAAEKEAAAKAAAENKEAPAS